jgi:hypothetical protein
VTFPWTSYWADDVVLGSVGSTSLSKSIWNQYLWVSLVMDRDICRCQKMQKVVSGVVLRMDSYDLHSTRFFDKNELDLLFYSWSLVVSFSSNGLFFPGFRGGARNFTRNYNSKPSNSRPLSFYFRVGFIHAPHSRIESESIILISFSRSFPSASFLLWQIEGERSVDELF